VVCFVHRIFSSPFLEFWVKFQFFVTKFLSLDLFVGCDSLIFSLVLVCLPPSIY
jgi:hypothetical protein